MKGNLPTNLPPLPSQVKNSPNLVAPAAIEMTRPSISATDEMQYIPEGRHYFAKDEIDGEKISRAKSLIEGNNFLQAQELLSEVIESDPINGMAFCGRGIALAGLEKYEEALQDFNAAVALDPTMPDYLDFRAQCHGQLGKLEEALADWNRLLELEPKNQRFISSQKIMSQQVAKAHLAKAEKEELARGEIKGFNIVEIGLGIWVATFGTLYALAEIFAPAEEKNNPQPQPKFISDEEATIKIRYFAQDLIGRIMNVETLTAEEKQPLALLAVEDASTVFNRILDTKCQHQRLFGINDDGHIRSLSNQITFSYKGTEFVENFATAIPQKFTESSPKAFVASEEGQALIEQSLSEASKKYVGKILTEIGIIEGAEKNSLQEMLSKVFNEFRQAKKISIIRVDNKEYEEVQDFENNALYDQILPDGEYHSKLNREKLRWAIGIFKEELQLCLNEAYEDLVDQAENSPSTGTNNRETKQLTTSEIMKVGR